MKIGQISCIGNITRSDERKITDHRVKNRISPTNIKLSNTEPIRMLIEPKCQRYKCKWYHGGKWPKAFKRDNNNYCNKYPCGIPKHIAYGYPKHPPQCEFYTPKKNWQLTRFQLEIIFNLKVNSNDQSPWPSLYIREASQRNVEGLLFKSSRLNYCNNNVLLKVLFGVYGKSWYSTIGNSARLDNALIELESLRLLHSKKAWQHRAI
jgi:hypothetical protein